MRGIWVTTLKQANKLRGQDNQNETDGVAQPGASVAAHGVTASSSQAREPARRSVFFSVVGGSLFFLLVLKLGHDCFQAMAYRDHMQAGIKAMEQGNLDVAHVEFSLGLAANPASVDTYFYRGLNNAQSGRSDESLADYNQAIKLDPQSVKSYVGRAWLYNRIKEYDKALDDCDTANKFDADYWDTYRIRANTNNHLGRYDQAVTDSTAYLEHSNTLDAERADALAKRAYALDQKHEYQGALRDYTGAIACDPQNPALYGSRSIVYMQMHKWQDGLNDCNRAITLKPNDVPLYKVRGLCLAGLKLTERSLNDLDKLVAYHPDVDTHRERGNARFNASDYLGTLADFDYVLQAEPEDKATIAKYQAAKLKLAASAPVTSAVADRVPHAKEATANDLKLPPAQLLKKGYDLMCSGDSDPAIDYLTAAVDALPQDPTARKYLSYALAQAGRSMDAANEFVQLSKLTELNTNDQLVYGKTLAACARTTDAMQVFYKLLVSDPQNDQARIEFIKVCLTTGDTKQAIKLASDGAAISPQLAKSYSRLVEKQLADQKPTTTQAAAHKAAAPTR